MTRIIMIRHGQSLANAQRRFAGHSDFDLSELGKKQAEAAAQYLCKKEKVDVIYASDLLRAHNTALPFSKVYSLPINDTEELREIFAGEWEGLTTDELFEIYGDDFRVWRGDFSKARCTGGESVAELYDRIVPSVMRLAEQNDGKCILLATHATPVRAIEANARGLGREGIGDISFVKNSSINIFEYENGVITPVATNLVEHLDESLVTDVPPALKDSKN